MNYKNEMETYLLTCDVGLLSAKTDFLYTSVFCQALAGRVRERGKEISAFSFLISERHLHRPGHCV